MGCISLNIVLNFNEQVDEIVWNQNERLKG